MLKKYKIKVNGNEYEVEVEEIKDSLTGKSDEIAPAKNIELPKTVKNQAINIKPKNHETNKSSVVPSGAITISAPMPGTILRVDVKEGDLVKSGQVLLILEAMKMENEITAINDGKIASINVEKGDSVNAGDIMISVV